MLAGVGAGEVSDPDDGEDPRPGRWARLRDALRPIELARDGTAARALADGVRAVLERRIVLLERGAPLSDEPDGRMEALSGTAAADVVACAFALDELRRLNDDERISGELGYAMRRWAWAEMHRALERLATEEGEPAGLR